MNWQHQRPLSLLSLGPAEHVTGSPGWTENNADGAQGTFQSSTILVFWCTRVFAAERVLSGPTRPMQICASICIDAHRQNMAHGYP